MIIDVVIDTLGVLVGATIVYCIIKLINRGKNNEQKSSNNRSSVDMQE